MYHTCSFFKLNMFLTMLETVVGIGPALLGRPCYSVQYMLDVGHLLWLMLPLNLHIINFVITFSH